MAFARFMASPTGRILRILAGLGLIGAGLVGVGGTTGWILAAVGGVPLFAGAANVCLIAGLIGAPLRGKPG